MTKDLGTEKDRQGNDGEIETGWDVATSPAVGALLDHMAQDLAVEFVRLMRVSVSTEGETEREKEKK